MTKVDLFEEIRSLLLDAQRDLGINDPQVYDDETLILQVRSALRNLLSLAVVTDAAMATDGTLLPEPTDTVGLLIALRVVSSLLRGDMISRITSGEFGVLFSMGNDTVDTKTAAIQFKNSADAYDNEFRTLLTIVLSDAIQAQDVFGGPLSPGSTNL